MKFTLKTTGFSLDEALKRYVDAKLTGVFRKLLKKEHILDATTLDIEIGRTTHHHNKGKVWRAEVNAALPGSFLRCEAAAEDLRQAIDLLSVECAGEIKKYKEKKVSKMKRGARMAKRDLKLDPAARMRKGGRERGEGA